MKTIKSYISEEFATPMNTTGMGDVAPGIVDSIPIKRKKKKYMKKINEYLNQINEAKSLSELKEKLANLKVGEQIEAVFVVRGKLTELANSGQWMVSDSLSIYKAKSIPRRIEKYYFVHSICNDSETVLKHMYKAIGKKYSSDDLRTGFSLEEIYKMLDSFPNGMISGSDTSTWYGHYLSSDAAYEKAKELSKPYKISTLKNKINAIEKGISELEQMKQELQELEKGSNE